MRWQAEKGKRTRQITYGRCYHRIIPNDLGVPPLGSAVGLFASIAALRKGSGFSLLSLTGIAVHWKLSFRHCSHLASNLNFCLWQAIKDAGGILMTHSLEASEGGEIIFYLWAVLSPPILLLTIKNYHIAQKSLT